MAKKKRVHFIGIGGVGMSGLAMIMHSLGYEVSGCDISKSKYTELLEKKGIKVYYGHSPFHVESADIVVYSSAIPQNNPELLKAKELGIWVIPRAQMLSEVMNSYSKSIVVAGSHGKTTTTSMISEVLIKLEKNPTVIVGGIINNFKTHSLLGEKEFLVAEADESDGSFLCYNPYIEVITTIDKEHLDFYADFNAIKKAFINFIKKCSSEGKVILCGDDPGVKDILQEISGPFLLYGFSEGNQLVGKIIEDSAHPKVEVYYLKNFLGSFKLSVPGKHNVLNALATIGVALILNLPISEVINVLKEFKGVERRLEFKGIWKGSILFDDYAHHPTEIKATLSAIKKLYPNKKLVLIFQPHRYTRMKALWDEFLLVLKDPEVLILTDIYPASEKPIPGISGFTFFETIKNLRTTKPTFYGENFEEILKLLETLNVENQIILTMGAGNIYKLHKLILKQEKNENLRYVV
ncbi:MAG TPA: UDP-N-acetylmuramate--L-alanine ligase [Thermodesulfobacterium geofontis]|nr:UDP-N-acetylmuramate--L-alanine ligase [Thermodesulfobacterium geofontis]